MAWEKRGRGRQLSFYYRVRRVGGKVVKEYVGKGPAAEEAARQDAIRLADRQRLRQEEAARREEIQALDRLLAGLAGEATAIVKATLVAAGFYQHRREWRRRRVTKEN